MLEWLIETDQRFFLALNHFRADWMDPVMLFLSAKKVWYPLYALIIGLIAFEYKKKAIVLVLMMILSVIIADQITSSIMKPGFRRYRPCHEPALVGQVLTPGKCGGKYGYASSHASATFAAAAFFFFLFKGRRSYYWWLYIWSSLIAYSRVYLGVHYPLDIITGALIGIVCSWLIYKAALIVNGLIFRTEIRV